MSFHRVNAYDDRLIQTPYYVYQVPENSVINFNWEGNFASNRKSSNTDPFNDIVVRFNQLFVFEF